jgi:hypothetical protein
VSSNLNKAFARRIVDLRNGMTQRQLSLKTGVGVEKLKISEKQYKFGDRKCLGDPDKSFVGHPDAI